MPIAIVNNKAKLLTGGGYRFPGILLYQTSIEDNNIFIYRTGVTLVFGIPNIISSHFSYTAIGGLKSNG